MRLIDADAFRRYAHEQLEGSKSYSADEIIEMIDKQPTAYNVEKVVAELEKLPNREADYYYANSNDVIDREDAIDIVKRGGVE